MLLRFNEINGYISLVNACGLLTGMTLFSPARVHPEGRVSGLLGAAGLRVSTVDEEFRQQLRASP